MDLLKTDINNVDFSSKVKFEPNRPVNYYFYKYIKIKGIKKKFFSKIFFIIHSGDRNA